MCQPIATVRTTESSITVATPPVASAHGIVYVSDEQVKAYVANGLTPLWTAPSGFAFPSLAGGVLYGVTGVFDPSNNTVRMRPAAFDASGTTGCSGTPKICTPLWTGPTGPPISINDPVLFPVRQSRRKHRQRDRVTGAPIGCAPTPSRNPNPPRDEMARHGPEEKVSHSRPAHALRTPGLRAASPTASPQRARPSPDCSPRSTCRWSPARVCSATPDHRSTPVGHRCSGECVDVLRATAKNFTVWTVPAESPVRRSSSCDEIGCAQPSN